MEFSGSFLSPLIYLQQEKKVIKYQCDKNNIMTRIRISLLLANMEHNFPGLSMFCNREQN